MEIDRLTKYGVGGERLRREMPRSRKKCNKCSRTRTIVVGRLGMCNKCFVLVVRRAVKAAIKQLVEEGVL